jgi:transposase
MKKGSTRVAQASRKMSRPKLTSGLDLGDRSSWYCVLDEAGTLLDRLTPKIHELNGKLEQIVERRPVTRQLSTHPGVRPLTALAFELVIGTPDRFQCAKPIASLCGAGAIGRVQRRSAPAGPHQQAGQRAVALLAGGSGPGHGAVSRSGAASFFSLAMRRGRKIAK